LCGILLASILAAASAVLEALSGWECKLRAATEHDSEAVRISIVIPVHNEEESLLALFQHLTRVLQSVGQPYEIIFVDDGSSDSSLQILKGFVTTNPEVIAVEQRTNFGKSAALNTGFSVARGEILFTLDADLQDDPDEIPALLAKLEEGYDLVTGLRANRWSNDPLGKTIPSRVANAVTRLVSGVPLRDMNSGFKGYRREVIQHIRLHSDLHRYIPVLAYYQGFRIVEVPITHHARQHGFSKYGTSRFLRSLFDLLTVLFLSRFRYRPLHLFGVVGAASGGLGTVILVYLSMIWLFTDSRIGDRPLLLLGVLLVIIGIQFVSIGLVADLVVSIDRNREDPQSTVRKIHRDDQS
jgi:glycosyltransferase involved in cell wall biosynthesis